MDHWTEKEVWIAEAIQAGGSGRIYCDDCSTYEQNGFGCMCCRTCREAERCFPGKSVEYWNGGYDMKYNKRNCPYFGLNNCINDCENCSYKEHALKTRHNQCLECNHFCNGCDGDTQPCEAFEYRKEEKTFDDWFTGGRGYQSDDPLWIPE